MFAPTPMSESPAVHLKQFVVRGARMFTPQIHSKPLVKLGRKLKDAIELLLNFDGIKLWSHVRVDLREKHGSIIPQTRRAGQAAAVADKFRQMWRAAQVNDKE